MSLLKRIEQGQVKSSSTSDDGGENDSSRIMNLQTRRVAPPGVAAQRDTYLDLKTRVQNRLLAELDPTMDITRVNDVRSTIQELFEQVLAEENIVLSRPERARLFEQIAAEIASHPEVSYLIMVSGEFDLIVEVLCKNREHLANFINYKLRRVDGVERTQTFMTLRTFKMAYGSPPILNEPQTPDKD